MERMKVTRNIFDEVTQTGARFLRKDPVLAKTWYLVRSHKVARDKISHYLRRLEKDGHPTIARGDDISNQRCREQDSSRALSHNNEVDLLGLVRKASSVLHEACRSTDALHCTSTQGCTGSLVGAWQHQVGGLFAPISTQCHASLQTLNSSPSNASFGTSITNEACCQQDHQGVNFVTPDKGLSSNQPMPPFRILAPVAVPFVPVGHPTNASKKTSPETSAWATRETATPPSRSSLCSQCSWYNHARPLQQPSTLTYSSSISIGGNDSNNGVDASSTKVSVATHEVCNVPPTLSARTSSGTGEVDHELNQLVDSFLLPSEHGGQDGNLWEALLGHQGTTIDLDDNDDYQPIATFQ